MKSLEIYKLLPRTNCGKCGFPTCLAFAMRIAAQKAEPKQCPYLSEESNKILEQQARAAVVELQIGNLKIGGETVMHRHEKRFFNPPPFAILLKDTLTDFELKKKIEFIDSLKVDRIGELLEPEMIALNVSDLEKSKKVIEKLKSKQFVYIGDIDKINSLLSLKKGVVFGSGDLSRQIEVAHAHDVLLVVSAKSVEELAELSKKAAELKFEKLIFNVEIENSADLLDSLVRLRKESVVDGNKLLGYPVICLPKNLEQAAFEVARYASLIVLENFSKEEIFALLTLRQNIFTDPQKPIQVEPGIYEINNPGKNSPVLVTSNFSLTFFNVKSDLENSKLPAYLLVVDTEGLSVLTAWAAGKFSPDKIDSSIQNFKLSDKSDRKELIIPGLVAMISGELEEKSGYKVLVGPKDSSTLPLFLKTLK